MRRKTKILVGTVAAIALVCASGVWYFTSQPRTTRIATEVGEESEEQEVVVKINENIDVPIINENIEVPKIYETIVDESGADVAAEVQEHAPPEKKPEVPPEKPKASGSCTNPDAPPTYTKEQTVIEEKPKQRVSQNISGGGSKVYIDGFGCVEQGSSAQAKAGQSTGDITKMVGSMD